MKTFETEKNNIPEGATHYRNEDRHSLFTWLKVGDDIELWCDIMETWRCIGSHVNCVMDKLTPIPQTKEVEWVNGELLEFMGEPCVFIGMSEGLPVVRYKNNADNALSGTIDVITAVDMLSKPETEAERVEREELEAAYDFGA